MLDRRNRAMVRITLVENKVNGSVMSQTSGSLCESGRILTGAHLLFDMETRNITVPRSSFSNRLEVGVGAASGEDAMDAEGSGEEGAPFGSPPLA